MISIRAVGRSTLFEKSGDYEAFLKVLRQAKDWQPLRLLAYCVLPTHWHWSCGRTRTAMSPSSYAG